MLSRYRAIGTVLGLSFASLLLATTTLAQDAATTDTAQMISRGAQLYSRNCQRCHNPRGPDEFNAREWVIIMQHMATRANITRRRADLVRTFLLASLEAAQSPGRTRAALAAAPDTSQITPAMIAAGRTVFHGAGGCAGCHGSDLSGGPLAPNLKDTRWKNGDGSYQSIVDIIRNGVAGTAMAAYPSGISDELAVRVAAYVWAVSHGKVQP